MKVLMVYHNNDGVDTYRLALEFLGHQVGIAASIEGALEALQSTQYKVIVTEPRLPDGEGGKLAADAKEAFGEGVKVICVAQRGVSPGPGFDAIVDHDSEEPTAEIRDTLARILPQNTGSKRTRRSA